MKIFPAIDLIEGKVVRLTKGDYNKVTYYNTTPEQTAIKYYNEGAKYLHVVDLDGAKKGKAINANTIEKIMNKVPMFVEVGGGIRTTEQIEDYLSCGAARVILGTAAVNDKTFLIDSIKKYGNKIAVGVDARNGNVAINGWNQVTKINSIEFCKQLEELGVDSIIYTDISKDGTLNGTNLSVYDVLCQTLSIKITASGGVTYLNEINQLAKTGVDAVIIGKAIYEGIINLKDIIKTDGGYYAK